MQFIPTLLLQLLLCAILQMAPATAISQHSNSSDLAHDLLGKVVRKLQLIKTVSYTYAAEIMYKDENYHVNYAIGSYIDFTLGTDIPAAKFQFSTNDYLSCYNGKSFFTLDHKTRTINISEKPDLKTLEQLSALNNSLITLRSFLPYLLHNTTIDKKVKDTIINEQPYFAISFTLQDNYISPAGYLKQFESVYTGSKFKPYLLLIDKKTSLPFQFITKFYDREKDFIAVTFSEINLHPKAPREASWNYNHSANLYSSPKPEKALIRIGDIPGNWRLPIYAPDKIDSVSLADYKGKIVVLDFWIKSCGPCIASFPHLNELQKKYGIGKMQLISINTEDKLSDIKFFHDKYGIDYSMCFGAKQLALDYGIAAYPAIVIMDKNGRVIFSGYGFDKGVIDSIIADNL